MTIIHLRVEQVTTILGNKHLLDNVSFTVKQGSVLALVGHNGAGKSTMMRTIMRMLEKQSGKIMIQEKYDQEDHFLEFKRRLAYLPEEPLLLPELTVMQHFQLYGMSYEMDDTIFEEKWRRFVAGFNITDKLHVYPEELSKGMRQKVQAICALLPDVPVLLIDEPFMGLDIYARDYIMMLMREKVASGTSIVLTTHQLDTLEELADEFVLLESGKVKGMGRIEEFDTITRGVSDD